MQTLIRTRRLVMGLLQDADAPAATDFYTRNRDHLQPWSPTFPAEMFGATFWREQAARLRAEHEAGVSARMYIAEAVRPERLIGNLSLTQIVRTPAHSCVLGYSLDFAAQGQGFMVEAVTAAVEHAFSKLNLHRVTAGYMPHNRRSAMVLRRCGFGVEGYSRDFLLIDGRWEDHILTARLNPAWSVER